MPQNWKTYNLESALEIKNGKSRPNDQGVFPVYGGNGILGYADRYNVEHESVLIGRVGAYCGSVYYENTRIWVSDNCLFGTPKEGFDGKFLYYLLKWANLNRHASGSSQPLLTQGALNSLKFKLPESVFIQRRIASILGALDDKIELNLEMNKTLEEMAMALYKHCFVDFGPFKDGNFVESELGLIPEGWEVKGLLSIAAFKNGKGINRKDQVDNGKYVILGSNGPIGRTDETMFNKPVVAIGRVGANYGEIHYSIEPCWISDNAVTVQPISDLNFWWLLQTLRSVDYTQFASGSAQPLITQGAIKQIKCAVPDNQILDKFSDKLDSLFSLLQCNLKEIKILTKTRDTLLPKLISGEIEVKAAEERLNGDLSGF